ncbi:MAG: hypothetical protein AAB617_01665 [Patescibacteria group bacterium]|mgnify:CR=1
MKYRVCDKCGEFVVKTGFVSITSIIDKTTGRFAKCNNKKCGKYFSKLEYEKLKEDEF